RLNWTKSKPEYAGEFVKFPPMMTWPKPTQKPHPPVLVGGAFPHGARRALARAAGRDPATVPITVFGVAEDGDLIKRYRDAGVARLLFNLPAAKADEV